VGRKISNKHPDWESGVKLQLMSFKSFPIKKKIKMVEEMEYLAKYMLRKKKSKAVSS
jgi:hypothetical protein